MKANDLEERLIDFATNIIELVETVPNTKSGKHLTGQLLRSGTSGALNYGEARAAESKRDFVHKMRVILKEKRESYNCIRLIERSRLHSNDELLMRLKQESFELIAIFTASINTTLKRL